MISNDELLTEKNFLLYAAKCHDSPRCLSIEEFHEDLKRIKYIKKLLTRYEDHGELKERLILNHIIVLCNVFGPKAVVRMLFLKMERQMKYVKPFLVYLNIMPERVFNVGKPGKINTSDVPMDQKIIDILRKI